LFDRARAFVKRNPLAVGLVSVCVPVLAGAIMRSRPSHCLRITSARGIATGDLLKKRRLRGVVVAADAASGIFHFYHTPLLRHMLRFDFSHADQLVKHSIRCELAGVVLARPLASTRTSSSSSSLPPPHPKAVVAFHTTLLHLPACLDIVSVDSDHDVVTGVLRSPPMFSALYNPPDIALHLIRKGLATVAPAHSALQASFPRVLENYKDAESEAKQARVGVHADVPFTLAEHTAEKVLSFLDGLYEFFLFPYLDTLKRLWKWLLRP
jgi:hypothetical protein